MARSAKRPLIAVLLVLGVLATASVGSAASLTIAGGSLGTHAAGHPCPGTLAATTAPTSLPVSTVTVTAPPACAGRTLTVAVNDGVNVRQGIATAPASGSVAVGLNGTYSPSAGTQVAAVVNGWYLATSWTNTPPVVPPTSGAVTPGTSWTDIRSLTWPTVQAGQQFCFAVTVSTTNGNGQQDWALNLNVAQRPFNNATSGYQLGGADAGKVAFTSEVPVGGVLQIVGTNSYKKLRSSDSLSFTVCNDDTPPPAYDPALTYTVTQGPVTGDNANACVATTVSVTGTPIFFAGWRADINMTAAIALASSGGQTFSGVYATGDSYTMQQLPGNIWRVSGAHWDNYGIRDGMTRTVVLCAN